MKLYLFLWPWETNYEKIASLGGKNTHFHKIGSCRHYWLDMHMNMKRKKEDGIETTSKLVK